MAAAVQDNMDVGMEYTLTVDGAVVDSTNGKEPFHYVHGRRQVIPGLE
ncbi:MAG: peptidylprolyl isomerase, partial [Candidatus Omnitrophica bacterium]|nr:peptidylprolyl isomerase [Candidatus Omnitrophota bacterium]